MVNSGDDCFVIQVVVMLATLAAVLRWALDVCTDQGPVTKAFRDCVVRLNDGSSVPVGVSELRRAVVYFGSLHSKKL